MYSRKPTYYIIVSFVISTQCFLILNLSLFFFNMFLELMKMNLKSIDMFCMFKDYSQEALCLSSTLTRLTSQAERDLSLYFNSLRSSLFILLHSQYRKWAFLKTLKRCYLFMHLSNGFWFLWESFFYYLSLSLCKEFLCVFVDAFDSTALRRFRWASRWEYRRNRDRLCLLLDNKVSGLD